MIILIIFDHDLIDNLDFATKLPISIKKFYVPQAIRASYDEVMIKNNQYYQSILILIMVQKNLIKNRINFSLGMSVPTSVAR